MSRFFYGIFFSIKILMKFVCFHGFLNIYVTLKIYILYQEFAFFFKSKQKKVAQKKKKKVAQVSLEG